MSLETKSCYIYSENKSLSPIYLPDQQEVFVGRSVDTKIADTRCSRQQVRLYASYADQKVFVQQVGTRPSGFNGFKTERGVSFIAQHGDCLEVLYGKYLYRIEFNPPPPKLNVQTDNSKKRLFLEDSEHDGEPSTSQISKLEDSIDDRLSMSEPKKSKLSEEYTKKYDNKPSATITSNILKTDDSSENGLWKVFSNKTLYVYTSNSCTGRSKIAGYDMDKTLIKTRSGLEFPKDANDWQILYPEVPGKLKKYYEDGYKVVIFSNQANLGAGKISLKDFKLKIERLVKKIGVPMQAYLAVGQSIYRKPRTGMWDVLVKQLNDDVAIEKEHSFFVGDAAGRPAGESRKKKDHSIADRLLALNLNLTFYTPEEHFLGHKKTSYNAPSFHPKEASKNTILYEPVQTKLTSDSQEMIIMVGSPGSGKSHFAKEHLKSYFYVNRDILGSWQKCVEKAKDAMVKGKSVVIDNTNPDKLSRQRYIDIAKEHKIPVRCFFMNLDKEHIKHNNMFRILTDPKHQVISDMIINSYTKNFVPPHESEGFSEIVKVKFVPQFKSEEEKRLYEMYLLG